MTTFNIILLCISAIAIFVFLFSIIKVGSYPDVQENKSQPGDRQQDRQEIQSLLQIMIDGWNRNDGTYYATAFTETCDYIAFNGERYITQKQNAEVHQKLFDTVLKGSSLVNQKIINCRFPNDNTAIVITTGYVKTRFKKHPPKSRFSIQTLVAIKENEKWKFTSFQNSRVQHFTLLDGFKMFLS